MSLGEAILNNDISTFYESDFGEPLRKSDNMSGLRLNAAVEKPHDRYRRLLRMRCKGRCDRTSKEYNELAPPHEDPGKRIKDNRSYTSKWSSGRFNDVRLGSIGLRFPVYP